VTKNTICQTVDVHSMGTEIKELSELAVRGLVPMFDPQSQLFCFRLKRSRSGMIREGLSRRYTIMVLLGLHRREKGGLASPIKIEDVLGRLLRDTAWITNIGDLGLLLWVCASASPDQLKKTWTRLDLPNALTRYREVSEGRTMELAWFLSGLAQTRLVSSTEQCPGLDDLVEKCFALLGENQGNHGYFGHSSRKGAFAGVLRGHIGSFADQVYPIYALTRFAEAYKVQKALEMAHACAEAICRAQGEQGQWWWHYDSQTGRVVERYPVYSVHQHGMAPMALLALTKSYPGELTPAIYKGLRWLAANNEIGSDLRDNAANVIWRCISPRGYRRYIGMAASLLGLRDTFQSPDNMAITWECRPYELGWLLYAFPAGDTAMPPIQAA